MRVQQPSNQIKLTNVSIVRLKSHGLHFQLAAYKNKILEYRSGVETDLDEVLQIHNVFTNVSKGQVSPDDALRKAFGSKSKDEIILEILRKGEVQVSEGERKDEQARLHTEILDIVSQKIVNPATKRPYTVSILQKALADLNFNPTLSKSAKAQALEGIKLLVSDARFPAARARMRVHITSTKRARQVLHERLQIEEEEVGPVWECWAMIEPGQYRHVTEVVGEEGKGRGTVEVLDMAVVHEGDEHF